MLKWIGICVLLLIMAATISACDQEITSPELGPVEGEPSLLDESSGESPESIAPDTQAPDEPEAKSTEAPDEETVDQKAITTPEVEGELPNDALQRKLQLLAMQDLAEKLEIELDQVRMLSIESVTWPDASLGCPEPGMFYAQVLSPGYRVVLIVEDEEYYYHADTQGEIFLCDIESMPTIRGTPIWRSPDGK